MIHSPRVLPTTTLFILLLISAATPSWAGTCLFYTTKEACTRYTDSGSCIWNAQAKVCLHGGPSLPKGTVGVALVGLDPQSVPLKLKPGPRVSFGNVSLVNDTEINVQFGEEKSLNVVDGDGQLDESSQDIDQEALKAAAAEAAEAPKAEVTVFCVLPPVTGRCRGFFSRWYYDQEEDRCRDFAFGGCGGNENNFASKEECEAAAQEVC